MAVTEQELRAQMQAEELNLPDTEPTIDGVPMWSAVRQERALRERGMTTLFDTEGEVTQENLKGLEPYMGPLYDQGGTPGSSKLYAPTKLRSISENYAWNEAHMSAIVSGNHDGVAENAQRVRQGATIQNYVVAQLEEKYLTEKLYDFGVLEGLEGMEPEEVTARIMQEANRFQYAREPVLNLLAINMIRQGYGELPEQALYQTFDSLSPNQLEGLREQYRQTQLDDLQNEINEFAAELGVGLTGEVLLGEMVQQDLIPFYGTITRVVSTRTFMPQNLDIGNIRSVLPGEIRQEIREWFVDATQEERLDYINGIKDEFQRLRKGPYSAHFTRYGIIENLMGIFTPDLLENNVPKDGLDRFLGNLDVLLGSVFAAGVVAKRGVSLAGLFTGRKGVSARNAAAASGNRQAQDQLDSAIASSASRFGVEPELAAAAELPRPGNLLDDIEVAPDSVKAVVANADYHRVRVLENTNDITALGVSEAQQQRAIRSVIQDLTESDSIHPNHRMTAVEHFPDNVGARITVTYGQAPGAGWHDFGDLVDELLDIDPNLDIFTIVKRGKDGKLFDLGITANEIAQFATKGIVPATLENALDPFSATTRLFGGRKLSGVSNGELIEVAQDLDPKSTDFANITRVLEQRRSGDKVDDFLTLLDGDELYIRRSQDHYWQTTDVDNLTDVFRDTKLPSWALPPNYKFTDRFYESFNRAFLIEEQTRAEFGQILQPFTTASVKDKEFVQRMFEWTEDWAKDMYEATNGVETSNPSWATILSRFPDATEGQLQAYAAVRSAMDLQYELFNRRLYRNWVSDGYQTARSVDGSAPNYHGVRVENPRPGQYYDPYNNKPVNLDEEGIADLYANGGTLLRLDMEIDGPRGSGMFDTVVVRSGDYQIGDLSKTPLNYYAGYTTRFYDDPVYIVKYNEKPTINGVRVDRASEPHKQAIRTAGSTGEATRWLNRGNTRALDSDTGQYVDLKQDGVYYKIERASNIDVQEGTLYQKNALYREGRLFWDKRQHNRLPDVNGGRAKIEDIQQTLEKGTAMAMRQATQEDLIKKFKNAIGRTYGDLISPRELAGDDLTTIIKKLRRKRADAIGPNEKARINEAIKITRYLQSQLGTDSFLVPKLREQAVNLGSWISSFGGKIPPLNSVGGFVEKVGAKMDPFRRMRTVAWYSFMVFRPVRQLLLQSMQLTYLSGIAPGYIASGKVFTDSLGLWRGMAKSRKGKSFNDGWSDAAIAKSMGLKKAEYQRLVQEFDRSGLVDTVNVHGFNPRAGATSKIPLPSSGIGRLMYTPRVAGRTLLDKLQLGFDIGEGNNLRFTYMIALRRKMRNENRGILDFKKEDWNDLAQDASSLALGMTRPNKFTYQTGMVGTMTQFLSFGHKALLGMVGSNPSISGKEAIKIALAGYALWGFNLLGAEDTAREYLSRMGLHGKANIEVYPGVTLQDLIAAGLVETSFNAIMNATLETDTELNLGVFAPGANVRDVWTTFYETAAEGVGVETLAGPSGTPIAGGAKGLNFIFQNWNNDSRAPQEKFLKGAEILLNETLPGFNDANRAWFAYQTGIWLDKDGDTLPIQPTKAALIARGLLGVRTEEESSLYRVRYLAWQEQENINAAVKGNQDYLKRLLTSWGNKEYGDEYIYSQVQALFSLYEDAPSGVREEIYKRSLIDPTDLSGPSILDLIAEMHNSGTNLINDFIPHLQNSADFTAEEKKQLTEYLIEIRDADKIADDHYQNILEDDL